MRPSPHACRTQRRYPMRLSPLCRTPRERARRAVIAVGAALLIASALGAAAAIPAAAAAGCQATYTISSQWNGGFTANVSITNLGSPVTAWTAGWTFPGNQQVTQIWNGSATQSGQSVTVGNLSYNGS